MEPWESGVFKLINNVLYLFFSPSSYVYDFWSSFVSDIWNFFSNPLSSSFYSLHSISNLLTNLLCIFFNLSLNICSSIFRGSVTSIIPRHSLFRIINSTTIIIPREHSWISVLTSGIRLISVAHNILFIWI